MSAAAQREQEWPCCQHCDPELSGPGEMHSAPCPECQDFGDPDSPHYPYGA